jgi:hypothetical protein
MLPTNDIYTNIDEKKTNIDLNLSSSKNFNALLLWIWDFWVRPVILTWEIVIENWDAMLKPENKCSTFLSSLSLV